MSRVLWTEPAVADLEAIFDFIARDSDVYAAATIERILDGVERLAAFPQSGRSVPEWRKPSLREIVIRSYRVIYRVRRDTVEILTVIHGARKLPRTSRRR